MLAKVTRFYTVRGFRRKISILLNTERRYLLYKRSSVDDYPRVAASVRRTAVIYVSNERTDCMYLTRSCRPTIIILSLFSDILEPTVKCQNTRERP